MILDKVTNVSAIWIDTEYQVFEYETVSESLVIGSKSQSLRFKLREVNDDDIDSEVVIIKKRNSYVFKTDYWEESLMDEFPLKPFIGDQETILFHNGDLGIIYFHLNT